MLKEKEKRTLLIVILGVSLVSLLAALISGLISGFMYFVNGELLAYTRTDHVEIIFGLFLFTGMGLGTAYLILYLIKKNYRNLVVFILLIAQVGYFVLTTLILYLWIVIDQGGDLYRTDFSYVESYIASMLTVLIPSALIWVSSLFLHKSNQKEEQAATETEVVTETSNTSEVTETSNSSEATEPQE